MNVGVSVVVVGAGLVACAGFIGRKADGVKPLSNPALAYFQQNCSHCHGPYGSGYGPSFYQIKDQTFLHKEVEAMASGPGQSPLKGDDLEAQTAYHIALIQRSPFLDVTERSSNEIAGEVTKGATISASASGKDVTVTVTKTHWRIENPPSGVLLKATLEQKSATLILDKESFSNPPKL